MGDGGQPNQGCPEQALFSACLAPVTELDPADFASPLLQPITHNRAYRMRVYPTPEQERQLCQLEGAARFLWNWSLQQRKEAIDRMAKAKTEAEAAGLDAAAVKVAVRAAAVIPGMQPKPLEQLISAAFTQLRKTEGTAWLSELPRDPLQQVLRDQQKAMVNYFEDRAGFPRFRRKRDFHGIRFPLDKRREQVLWSATDTPAAAADRERQAARKAKARRGGQAAEPAQGSPDAIDTLGRKPSPRTVLVACFGSVATETEVGRLPESPTPAAGSAGYSRRASSTSGDRSAGKAGSIQGTSAGVDGTASSARSIGSTKPSTPIPTSRWAWVTLPLLGWVKMRRTEALEGRLLSVTLTRNGAGQWFASLTAEDVPAPAFVGPETAAVGVDLGLRTLATTYDGETLSEVKPAKPFRKNQKSLKRLNRKQGRQCQAQKVKQNLDPDQPCPKGTHLGMSKRRMETKLKIGKLHVRIACQRLHATHEMTTDLALHAAILVLESLSVKGLAQSLNKSFRRSLHDVSLGEVIRQLKYKAQWFGRTLETVDRFYPSSKTCSTCLTVNKGLKLEKTWTCQTCGTQHDRDHNAAINIRHQGLSQVLARRALSQQLQNQESSPKPFVPSASAVPLSTPTGEQPGRKARGGAKGPAGEGDIRVSPALLRRPSPVKREPTPESPRGAHPSPARLERAGVGWG